MLLRLTSLRYLKQHPFLTLLSVLGVALGVAVVVAIDLTNVSARKAFELSSEGVTGKATHAVVGASSGVADSVYRQVRLDLGIRDSAPVVEGYVSAGERTLQVLGVDALAEAPFRTYLGEPGSGTIDLGTFMARPQTALLSEQTATALGLSLDDSLTVEVDGRATNLRIVGLLDPEDEYSERVLDNLLLTDIANAQSLLATENRLTRIDLIVPDGEAGEAMLAELGAALPDGVSVERSTARTETIAQMTRAFNLNLTALSFLALIVGMFLIYNTTTFSVVQRRLVIGRLRALGVSRGEIFSMVLGEALIVGIAGTVLGLLAGYLLATGLVQLVTQTINDLYYVVNVRQLDVEPWSLAKGVLLGIGATLAAAFAPARSATGEAPVTTLKRSVQEDRARTRAPWLGLAGVVLAAIGVGVLALPTRNLAVSYGGMLALLLAFAFATPLVLIGVSRLATPMLRVVGGAVGAMAGRGVASALSRTGIAVAALMVAIAATVGVGVMVTSFRSTVVTWLDYSLQADVYVQAPSQVFRRGDATIQPNVAERLMQAGGVDRAYSVRGVQVQTDVGRSDLVAMSRAGGDYRPYPFKSGDDPDLVWPALDRGEAVIISEPYAYRYGLASGDSLTIQTDRGPQRFRIAGVFFDYGSDIGLIMTTRIAYERLFDDRGFSGLAFYTDPDVSPEDLSETLRQAAGTEQALIVRSNRSLRDASMEIFDRTFTITSVLRLLAVLVAFIGVLSALMALALERSRELAVLRATGLTPSELWRYVTMQTGLLGLAAGLLSIPLGLVLAYVLTFVINKRSFGWTLQFNVDPNLLLQALLLGLIAALLAGLFPAWKMARANPALALRDE